MYLSIVPPNVTALTESPLIAIELRDITINFTITEADPLVNISNRRWTFESAATTNIEDITDTSNLHYSLSEDRLVLTINQVTSAHRGVYTLLATNEAGVRSDSVEVITESIILCFFFQTLQFYIYRYTHHSYIS